MGIMNVQDRNNNGLYYVDNGDDWVGSIAEMVIGSPQTLI